ncbi:hypothetical protein [Sorangium sp. So ce176]|uniref:hypothetical protein n=1 Tax=Sorangium sp. So ce176 TaxID=3133286 RepID=UPI003F5EE868
MKSLSFAAILVTVCAVAACSDDGGSGGDGGAGGGGGASGTTTSTTSAGSGSSVTTGTGGNGEGGNGEGGNGEGGNGEGGGAACTEQCFEENQQGGVEFLTLTLEGCGCVEGATCASTCDTADETTDACADDGSASFPGLQGNDACVDCLEGLADEDACIKTVEDACTASEGCNAFAECVAACP